MRCTTESHFEKIKNYVSFVIIIKKADLAQKQLFLIQLELNRKNSLSASILFLIGILSSNKLGNICIKKQTSYTYEFPEFSMR